MRIPTMSAVRYDGTRITLDEVRRVRPASGEVLVRVSVAHLTRRDGELTVPPDPVQLPASGYRTLGRLVVGQVAAPGAGVDGWPLGRTVVVHPLARIGRGWFRPGICADGGLAEYLTAPAAALTRVPAELTETAAALLPAAAQGHAMVLARGPRPGASLTVWGAGALGGAALVIARALGMTPLVAVDPDAQARATALTHGADAALDPTDPDLLARLDELTAGQGVDLGLHTAPDPSAAAQLWAALGPTGHGVLAGPVASGPPTERWDARSLSGPPHPHPQALAELAHLVAHGRLRLPEPTVPSVGLRQAAELLDAAATGGQPVVSQLIVP